jgi:hypothetical protein
MTQKRKLKAIKRKLRKFKKKYLLIKAKYHTASKQFEDLKEKFENRYIPKHVEGWKWWTKLQYGSAVRFIDGKTQESQVLVYGKDFHPLGVDSDFATCRSIIGWDNWTSEYVILES